MSTGRKLQTILRADGFLTISKELLKRIKNIEVVVFYQHLCEEMNYYEKQDKLVDGEWFFQTVERIERKLFFKKRKQQTLIKTLEELNLIETKRIGIPPRRFFKLNEEKIEDLFDLEEPSKGVETTPLKGTKRPLSLKSNKNIQESEKVEELFSKKKKDLDFAPVAHNPTMSRRVEGSYDEKVEKRRKLGGVHKPEHFLLQIPTPIFEVISFWNHRTGLPTHKLPELVKNNIYKNPTKTIINIVTLLKKIFGAKYYSHVSGLMKYNEGYSADQIKGSIRRHHAAATDHSYFPENKETLKKLSLINFFYNPFMDKNASLKIRSSFLHYLENDPALAVNAIPNVKLTKEELPYFEAEKVYFKSLDNPLEVKQAKSAARNIASLASQKDCLSNIVNVPTPYEWVKVFFESLYDAEEDSSLENGASPLAPSKVKKNLERRGLWSENGWEEESSPTYYSCDDGDADDDGGFFN